MEIQTGYTEITTNKIKKFTYRQWMQKLQWKTNHHELARDDDWNAWNKIEGHMADMFNKFNWKPFVSQNMHMKFSDNYSYYVKISGHNFSNF